MRLFEPLSRPAVVLFLVISAVIFCYHPGLAGGFLFDDYPNLEPLGAYGGVKDFETFKSFVWGGGSGPTGRPLSLASFLIDDNTWPSQAAYFKPTNLAIHLLCGLLLTWATLLLLRCHGQPEAIAQWMAVFSASCWLLHPYLVSTTLYVIQRMAQLASLFVFAGIAGYLHGRLLLSARPRAAYLWIGGSLIIGTLLAVLSKENGILLPLLVGVIEYCAPAGSRTTRPSRLFLALFIGLPSLAVTGYLASQIDFSPHPWPGRDFNQIERLLSEPRIIWDYLGNLYLPRIEGQGLYRDDFVISRNLFNPGSTLPALLGLLALTASAIAQRRRWPLFSLGILFFLAGHALESTLLGLELYFEHRNYLPAAFLFLPVATGLKSLRRYTSPLIPVFLAVTLIALLAFFTKSRAHLWGDTDKLELFWATSATQSPRAQNAVTAYYLRQGLIDDANRQITAATERLPNSALLTMRHLLQKVWLEQATTADFEQATGRLAHQPFDAQMVSALRKLVEAVIEPYPPNRIYRPATLRLLVNLSHTAAYNNQPLFLRLVAYLKGQIYLAEHRPDQALAQLRDAMERYHDTDSALQMVALMANSHYPREALLLLDQAEILYRQQADRTLKRSRNVYDHEFIRLRTILNGDISGSQAPSGEPDLGNPDAGLGGTPP